MSHRTKQRRSGGLTLLLYQRTLHPELFTILASEKVSRRAYDAEIWLVEGGHVTTLTAGKKFKFEDIPSFAPEHFARVVMVDPLRRKQLKKGLEQLSLAAGAVVQKFASSLPLHHQESF